MLTKPYEITLSILAISVYLQASHALTFSAALQAAKGHSEYKIDSLSLEKSQKQRQKSVWNLTPSLSLYSSRAASPDPKDFSETTWGISSTLNIFSGFGDFYNIKTESANFQSARSLRQTQQLEQELTVGQTYLKCLFYQTAEASALASHQVGTQIADIAKNRFDRGLTSKDEYLKLKIDAETSMVKYINEKSKKENCYSELKYWVGEFHNLEGINFKDATSLNMISDFPEDHPKFVYTKELVNREEYYSRVLLAKSLPQVNIAYSKEYSPLISDPITTWTISGTWSLFDSGQTWTNKQIQNIELEKVHEKLKALEKSLRRDSEILERTYTDNLKLYKILESNLQQIKSTFRTSLNRYRAGATTANDVALDQSRVILATYSLDDMWLQKHLSLIQYQNSLGKSVTELLR